MAAAPQHTDKCLEIFHLGKIMVSANVSFLPLSKQLLFYSPISENETEIKAFLGSSVGSALRLG